MSLSSDVVEASGVHSASVILLHSVGDKYQEWVPVAQQLALGLPHVKFILPTAPERPVTMSGGFSSSSWYDIKSLDKFTSNSDRAGMKASMIKINELIKSEIDSGIPANRIVLGGFSQGGAMTLFTGLQSEHQLAGLAVLNGYLPVRYRLMAKATKASKGAPIFLAHGALDIVVPYKHGEKARKVLEKKGYSVKFHSYGPLYSAAGDEEVLAFQAFLKKALPERVN
ncbi:hypothetical protein GGI20_004763 [Coemansia sp. BCRC 34301]|nr:hypothetical protein GGI20_004763 [Coemansia sp. BCRC 34301]